MSSLGHARRTLVARALNPESCSRRMIMPTCTSGLLPPSNRLYWLAHCTHSNHVSHIHCAMLPDCTGWSAECVHVPAPTALPESAHGIGKITWTWSDLAVIFGNPSRGWEEWLVRAAARSDNACTSLLVWEHTAFSLGAQNLGRPPPGRTWKFCSRKYTIGCAVK